MNVNGAVTLRFAGGHDSRWNGCGGRNGAVTLRFAGGHDTPVDALVDRPGALTHLAIGLIRDRLRDAFPQADFDVHGVPRDLAAARELAANDKHEFQLWTLSLINAQPYKGGRKGADGGVDGYIWFQPDGRNHEKAVVSVKGGENVDVKMIRDLIATVDREKAKVGVFVTLAEPTRNMKTEAAAAGFYDSPNHGRFPKIQILTIADLFAQQKPHLPWIAPSSKRAKREQGADKQMGLDV